MKTILDTIVADTRTLVQRRKATVSIRELEDRPFFSSPALPLDRALRRGELSIIAESKKASPSQGIIRSDYDVLRNAQQYKAHGASAISVLTEPFHFKGSLDDLATARRAVDLPLLRKDFVVDPYQLFEARAYGADAVLLIAAVLDKYQLYDLHQAADELGLSCLVELYDLAELDQIDLDQVRVLGVNNRDLRTFEVDINHSVRVFAEVPETVVRVAESGLRSADELVYLRQRGIDAVLIGETFMRAHDPGLALDRLRQEVRQRLGELMIPA